MSLVYKALTFIVVFALIEVKRLGALHVRNVTKIVTGSRFWVSPAMSGELAGYA
jgi:hypothetical protein